MQIPLFGGASGAGGGGAAGLTLTQATVAYLLEPALQPGIERQAAGRIARIGQSKETKLIIQFVIEAINESDEMSPIDVTNFEDEMTIREHENHYGIIVVSEVHESSFKIEKISGRIYDVVNAPIAPLPVFEDDNKREFKEIN